MPSFSKQSLAILSECHPDIQLVMNVVILDFDISITEGFRPRADQMEKVEQGLSQVTWPDSKHNRQPSEAVHALPYPFFGWNDIPKFTYMAGYIQAVADGLYREGRIMHRLRWGGNWDMDKEIITDQDFDDLAHFELVIR